MFQPGPKAKGLLLAPAVASPEGQASAPQREESIDGRGSSEEWVEPGRGLAGLRPNPLKLEGQPPLLSLLNRPKARRDRGTPLLLSSPAVSNCCSPKPMLPEMLLFRFLAAPSRPGTNGSWRGMLLALPSGGPAMSSDRLLVLLRCLMPNMPENLLPVPPPEVARFERVDRMLRRSASIKFSGEPRWRLFWLAWGLANTDGERELAEPGEAGPGLTESCCCCGGNEGAGPGKPGKPGS